MYWSEQRAARIDADVVAFDHVAGADQDDAGALEPVDDEAADGAVRPLGSGHQTATLFPLISTTGVPAKSGSVVPSMTTGPVMSGSDEASVIV